MPSGEYRLNIIILAPFPQIGERGRTSMIRDLETARTTKSLIDRIRVAALGRNVNARAAGSRQLMRMPRFAHVWLLASAVAAFGAADAFSAPQHKQIPPHRNKAVEAAHQELPAQVISSIPLPMARPAGANAPPLPPDLAAVKEAIDLVSRDKAKDATALAASVGD